MDAQQRAAEAEAAATDAAADRDAAVSAAFATKQQLGEVKADAARLRDEVTAVKAAAASQAQDMRQQLAAKDR